MAHLYRLRRGAAAAGEAKGTAPGETLRRVASGGEPVSEERKQGLREMVGEMSRMFGRPLS